MKNLNCGRRNPRRRKPYHGQSSQAGGQRQDVSSQQSKKLYQKQHGNESQIRARRGQIHELYLKLALLPSAEELQRDPQGESNSFIDNVVSTAKEILAILEELEKYGENLGQQRLVTVTVPTKFPKAYYNAEMDRLHEFPAEMRLSMILDVVNHFASGDKVISSHLLAPRLVNQPSHGQKQRLRTFEDVKEHGSYGHETWILFRDFPSQEVQADLPCQPCSQKDLTVTQLKSKNAELERKCQESTKQSPDKNGKQPVDFAAKPCAFCGGKHFNSKCNQFQTRQQRLKALLNQNKCVRCFQPGHTVSECKKLVRKCFNCEEFGHHRLLCKQKDTRKQRRPPKTIETSASEVLKSTVAKIIKELFPSVNLNASVPKQPT